MKSHDRGLAEAYVEFKSNRGTGNAVSHRRCCLAKPDVGQ
jgi:hypothetical protein